MIELDSNKTLILVIDMQNDFLQKGAPLEVPMGRELIGDLNNFLNKSRKNNIPVVFTKQVNTEHNLGQLSRSHPLLIKEKACWKNTTGTNIHNSINISDSDIIVNKHRYDAFWGTELDNILRNLKIKNLIITGVTSSGCCLDTGRGAIKREYNVVFLHDLTGTYRYNNHGHGEYSAEDIHKAACTIVGQTIGEVCSYEDVMFC